MHLEPLQPDTFYHIFNHANAWDNLFTTNRNYPYFIRLVKKHLHPFAQLYVYCLMPNHFHLLIKTRPADEIVQAANSNLQKYPPGKIISRKFANCFSAYTQAFNRQELRSGSLFIKNFRRKPLNDQQYLQRLVCYIHLNPVHHGFCNAPHQWNHSSFNTICRQQNNLLPANEIISWFDDYDNFLYCHYQAVRNA